MSIERPLFKLDPGLSRDAGDQAQLQIALAVSGDGNRLVAVRHDVVAAVNSGDGPASGLQFLDDLVPVHKRQHRSTEALGQQAEWRGYLAALREKHQRKYKLMPLLKVL
jgi:hypothetical protein